MFLELLKKYQSEIIELKKSQEENAQIKTYINILSNKDKFLNLDVYKFIDFLENSNYREHTKEEIKTTLIYMQRNDLFEDLNYQNFIGSLLAFIEKLQKSFDLSLAECDNLLKRIKTVLNDFQDENAFLGDFDLVIKILKENKATEEEIFVIMREINNKNKRVYKRLINESNHLDDVEVIDRDIDSNNQFSIIEKYGYSISFTPFEKSIIESIDSNELKSKLDFFEVTPEYNFLKNNSLNTLEHHLFVILLLTPLNNISTIYQIVIKDKLNVKNILPSFYLDNETVKKLKDMVSENRHLLNNKSEDKFYSMILVNGYEKFMEITKLFKELGCIGNSKKEETLLASLINKNPLLFMSRATTIEKGLRTFADYGIMVRNPNVLTIERPEELLDKFIEAGLYDYVKEHQSIMLEKDSALFKRIYYAKLNNLAIFRGTKLLSSNITNVDGYQINASNCDEKVVTYEPEIFKTPFYDSVREEARLNRSCKELDNPLIKVLDESFKVNNETYLIVRERISRLKVLRLMQAFLNKNNLNDNFEGLFFSIFNETLISRESYEEIVIKVMRLYYLHAMVSVEGLYNICASLGVEQDKVDALIGPTKGSK